MRRRALILTLLLLLSGTAVAYGVVGSGSGADDFPTSPPAPPALQHDYKGEPIILESGSPPARSKPEGREGDGDKLLDREHFEENSRRAVVPNTTGDDGESCHIAAAAKRRLDRREASRAEFDSEIARAKRGAASPTMRAALDKVLAGDNPPPCPPRGRP